MLHEIKVFIYISNSWNVKNLMNSDQQLL